MYDFLHLEHVCFFLLLWEDFFGLKEKDRIMCATHWNRWRLLNWIRKNRTEILHRPREPYIRFKGNWMGKVLFLRLASMYKITRRDGADGWQSKRRLACVYEHSGKT